MRIAFLTDLHLGAAGELVQNVDVRQNFLKALAFVADLKPDCLVLGGDICDTAGNEETYAWARAQVDTLPFPSYVISGNHDDSLMLASVFNKRHDPQTGELYYALPLEGRPALFLDSSKGFFSDNQWTWLREYFEALRDNNVVIFMHHPPLIADVVFMDQKYPFQQSEEFIELVRDLPCHVTVICGHYHAEKIVQRGNLMVLLTPSTFYQMNQDAPTFTIESYQIGIREVNLTTHGTSSAVFYIDPPQLPS